ncbi:MAG: choice-of-anchor L domain-containing protein, partial [Bacteroidota bacterium]
VSKSYSVETLVKDIFIRGACKNVTNIQPIGSVDGIGYFSNGSDVLNIEDGLIFSTGFIESAVGPNSSTQTGEDLTQQKGDKDLNLIAREDVLDPVGIEFDFVPIDSFVTFRYVFASEEYCEFVGSRYNDVFGFFVSGPGLDGNFSNKSVNVALIPGTSEFVAINSVNHLNNKQYYVGNEKENDAFDCEFPYTPSPYEKLIEYDGFTTVLTSELKLIPCETYHIRLVIADRGDQYYDSAVFLEAGSFYMGGAAEITAHGPNNGDVITEGCSDGYFKLSKLVDAELDESFPVSVKVSPKSTAKEGEDFEFIPRDYIIPAGDSAIYIPVNAFFDNESEAFDTLILELDYPCECLEDEAFLVFADPPLLQVDLEDQKSCPGDSLDLIPNVIGGNGSYSYLWNTGDTTSQIRVLADEEKSYQLTISDDCSQELVRTMRLEVEEAGTASINGNIEICPGEAASLEVRFIGEAPFSFSYSNGNGSTGSFSGLRADQNPFYFEVTEEGIYELTQFSDSRCSGFTLGQATVTSSRVNVNIEVTPASCHDTDDGKIVVDVITGNEPYEFEWFKEGASIQPGAFFSKGMYTLEITDRNDCTTTYNIEVPGPDAISEVTYDCSLIDYPLTILSAQGGTPPYTYSVDGNTFKDSRLFEELESVKLYDLQIKDARGCIFEQAFTLPPRRKDFVRYPEVEYLKFGEEKELTPVLLINEAIISRVNWFPSTQLDCGTCLEPTITALENQTYQIFVTNNFGCLDTSVVIVEVEPRIQSYAPTAFSPDRDGINDRFVIYADEKQVQLIKSLQIYDRWGNLVFSNTDFPPNSEMDGWNGRKQNVALPGGVYIYAAELELVNGTMTEIKGNVMLVR